MAASFPIVTVLISPEVVFSGPYSVNYYNQILSGFGRRLVLTLEIFSCGGRRQLRSP